MGTQAPGPTGSGSGKGPTEDTPPARGEETRPADEAAPARGEDTRPAGEAPPAREEETRPAEEPPRALGEGSGTETTRGELPGDSGGGRFEDCSGRSLCAADSWTELRLWAPQVGEQGKQSPPISPALCTSPGSSEVLPRRTTLANATRPPWHATIRPSLASRARCLRGPRHISATPGACVAVGVGAEISSSLTSPSEGAA